MADTLTLAAEPTRKAFEHTAGYDRAIADYLAKTEFAAVEKAYPEIMKRK